MRTAQPTILQIIPRLDTGGAELATVEISAAVTAAGGRALVATEGGRLAERVIGAGGEIILMPAASKNPLTMLHNALRLTRLIQAEGIHLLHARSRAPAWSALLAARRTRTPFVTTYHGAYAERGPLKRAYNSVMARADVVIANSSYTAGLIERRYATSPDRIVTIYRGIDPHVFSPCAVGPDRQAALRAAWGVPPEARIVLQAARLTSWKGQHVLIDAIACLNTRNQLGNAYVVLAGDAQGREAYELSLHTRIAALGLTGRVRVVGHVDDIQAAFATSHVAVIASTEPEAFGRAGAEAQAMCCPVIATRIGAPQETVHAAPDHPASAATGWLVSPADAEALADALSHALGLTAPERTEMGERARRHVTSAFSLERMKQETLAVYNSLLEIKLQQQLTE